MHRLMADPCADQPFGLTTGCCVSAAADDEDSTPFLERYAPLRAKLEEQFAEAGRLAGVMREKLDAAVAAGPEELGHGG